MLVDVVERLLDFFEREGLSVADPRLMELILGVAKKHRMLLPPDFVLISRALFQFEGFCRELARATDRDQWRTTDFPTWTPIRRPSGRRSPDVASLPPALWT